MTDRKENPHHDYKIGWHKRLLRILNTVTAPEIVFPWGGHETAADFIATALLQVCQHDLRDSGVPEDLIERRNWLFAIVNAGDPLGVGIDLLREVTNRMFDFETKIDQSFKEP